jgi:hypothetical protein
LDTAIRKSIGSKGRKKRVRVPTVRYLNKNLFTGDTFTEDFSPVFSGLYLKLLFRVWKLQGKL